jgi:hypothetical protein
VHETHKGTCNIRARIDQRKGALNMFISHLNMGYLFPKKNT